MEQYREKHNPATVRTKTKRVELAEQAVGAWVNKVLKGKTVGHRSAGDVLRF